MWVFLQEAKDLQKVSRLHPDDVLVFMMYPDGWPLNQHNIVLSAKVFFQGQCDEYSGIFRQIATCLFAVIRVFSVKPHTTFFLGHRFLAHVSLYHSRIPWKIYILHHVMLGLKTRIIAQVLAYALTAIEREPELGTIISTTYTQWAIICLKKYNLERLTSMFHWKMTKNNAILIFY